MERRGEPGGYLGVVQTMTKAFGMDPCVTISKPWSLIMPFIWIVVTSFGVSNSITQVMHSKLSNESDWVEAIGKTLNILATLAILLTNLATASGRRKLFLDLADLDRELSTFGGDVEETFAKSKKHRRFFVVLYSVVYYGFMIPFFVANPHLRLNHLLRFSAHIIRDVTVNQYLCSVDVLGRRFDCINSCLIAMNGIEGSMNEGRMVLKAKLTKITEVHRVLRRMVNHLNTHHGLQIILVLAVDSLSCTNYASLIGQTDFKDMNAITLFIIMGFYAVHLAILVYTCEVASRAANSTPLVLHKLENLASSEGLEQFFAMNSIDFLHDKVSFAALGVVSLSPIVFLYVSTPIVTYTWYYIKGK